MLSVEAGMEVGVGGIGLLQRIVAGGEGMIGAVPVEWFLHSLCGWKMGVGFVVSQVSS